VTGILPSTLATFDGQVGTFDEQTRAFNEAQYNAAEQYVVLADSANPLAFQNDDTEQYNGVAMTVYMERSHLPLLKDISRLKRVMRVYPRVLGTTGDTIDIKIGYRDALDGTVTYTPAKTFTIGTDYKVDFRISARVIDVRFEYSGSNPVRLFGYEVEFKPDGYR
jgi:hypothetical protein